MQCPRCGSSSIVKNGSNANGKKKFLCKDCSRQFVENLITKQYLMLNGALLTTFFLKEFSWLELQEQFPSQKDGFKKYVKKTKLI